MMIKIAVCDDSDLNCEALERILREHDFETELEIDLFASGEDLMKSITKDYNIVFLDIELNEAKTGVDYGKKIKERNQNTILIFISAFVTYFRELAECEPFAFIDKPFNQEREKIHKTLDRAVKRLKSKTFSFDFRSHNYNIALDDVVYFESCRRVILVHMEEQELQFYGKLDDVQKEIEEITNMFARANKGCYLNVSKIKTFTKSNVTMEGRSELIHITRKYSKEFMDKIFDYY